MDWPKSSMEGAEERISKPEDGTTEMTQSEKQRWNRWKKKMDRVSGTCGTTEKDRNIHVIHIPGEKGALHQRHTDGKWAH